MAKMSAKSSFIQSVELSDSVSAKWQQNDGMWTLSLSRKHKHRTLHTFVLTAETCYVLLGSRKYIANCMNGVATQPKENPEKEFLCTNLRLKQFWGLNRAVFSVSNDHTSGYDLEQSLGFELNEEEVLNLVKFFERHSCILYYMCNLVCSPEIKSAAGTDKADSEQLYGMFVHGFQWIRADWKSFLKMTVKTSDERYFDPNICMLQAEMKKPVNFKKYKLDIFKSVKYKVINRAMLDAACAKLVWVNICKKTNQVAHKEKSKTEFQAEIFLHGRKALASIDKLDIYVLCEKALKHCTTTGYDTHGELFLQKLFSDYDISNDILVKMRHQKIDEMYMELFHYVFKL